MNFISNTNIKCSEIVFIIFINGTESLSNYSNICWRLCKKTHGEINDL